MVVIGHSLGAGTASLFTLMFNEAYPDVPIHCYAYLSSSIFSIGVDWGIGRLGVGSCGRFGRCCFSFCFLMINTYAPPCIVSPEIALSHSTMSLIDSIVVGNDVVPRLSFATIDHLKQV